MVTVTNKQLEMHRCEYSTVATDALVLKRQGISIHSADIYPLYWSNFIQKYYIYSEKPWEIKLPFGKKMT